MLVMCLGISFENGTGVSAQVKTEGDIKVAKNVYSSDTLPEINGHNVVAENDRFVLYMLEDDLSVIVLDKETGAYMESSPSYDDEKNNKTWTAAMKSALVLTMINKSTDTKQADLINDQVTKKITYTNTGFEAVIYWTKYKFGMTLKVNLTEDGLTAFIPDESIIEDGTDYYIGTISIYPFMGTSYLDQKEGYMFIPDGNGAIIYLDNKEGRFNSGYSTLIYGDDIGFTESTTANLLWDRYETLNETNKILAPIYGLAHTDDKLAFLAIIENGAERASIEARPNGISVDYNRVYAKFIERKIYTQPTSNNTSSGSLHLTEESRSHSDLKIRYIFLNGDDANYCGMATAYRDYLLENGSLVKGLDNSFRTRVDFMGTERENWLLGTKAVVMTTTEDIKEIFADLESLGVKDILSVYKGWQSGGLLNLPIAKYKADSKIGGTKELTALIKDAEEKGIKLYLYNNALVINPDEHSSTFSAVKKVNKKKYEEATYKDVYDKLMYLIPAKSETTLEKFVKSYTKSGVKNLCVAGVSNTLFSYFNSGNFYTRFDSKNVYDELTATVSEKTSLVLEQPFEYLWSDTEAFLDMPVYVSNFVYEDDSVPFLSIVLKGVMPVYGEYINFEANKSEYFLKLIETGIFPSFYITKKSSSELIYTNSADIYSSEYSVYRDTIKSYYDELKKVSDLTEGAFICGHEIEEGGLRVITYTNGVKIYINYGLQTVTKDDLKIGSMSYKVVK